jgi:hypothetical protein
MCPHSKRRTLKVAARELLLFFPFVPPIIPSLFPPLLIFLAPHRWGRLLRALRFGAPRRFHRARLLCRPRLFHRPRLVHTPQLFHRPWLVHAPRWLEAAWLFYGRRLRLYPNRAILVHRP